MTPLTTLCQTRAVRSTAIIGLPPWGGRRLKRVDDALRIEIVAPAWYPLPPRGYGGTELVVHLLHTELRRLGHDVTVFGAEGSAPGVTMLADAAWSHDLGGPAGAARQGPLPTAPHPAQPP